MIRTLSKAARVSTGAAKRSEHKMVLRQAKTHRNKYEKKIQIDCKHGHCTNDFYCHVQKWKTLKRWQKSRRWRERGTQKKITVRCGRVEIMENDIRKSNSNKILGTLFIWFHPVPFLLSITLCCGLLSLFSLPLLLLFLFRLNWMKAAMLLLKCEPGYVWRIFFNMKIIQNE